MKVLIGYLEGGFVKLINVKMPSKSTSHLYNILLQLYSYVRIKKWLKFEMTVICLVLGNGS